MIYFLVFMLFIKLIKQSRFATELLDISFLQTWPVRSPRPVAAKLAADTPLLTGQVITSNLILNIFFLYISLFYLYVPDL